MNKKIEIICDSNLADLITHNGTFHADEVFATVVLSRILEKENIKLCRTSLITQKEKGVVYDIGYGKYDHHQPGGNGERENGVKYAAFGLIWKEFGKKYLKSINANNIDDVWEKIDKKLVQNIDAIDNGQLGKLTQFDFEIITLSGLISMYNSNWDDKTENQDSQFLKVLELANTIFDRVVKNAISKINAKTKINKAIEDAKNQILILDEFMPWKEFLLENEKGKDILFVVFPSNRGGYNVYAVPKELGSFESRKLFPEEWTGLKDEELQKVSGVNTATFCHANRFMSVAKTKEDAIEMAKIAVRN